jgi:EAL domain-containing protein (putative c-di-GMP-specific phosphodiesterase class I)
MTYLQRALATGASAIQPAEPPPRVLSHERSIVEEFERFMPRVIAGSMLIALADVVAGTVLSEPTLLAAAVLTACFGMLILGARALQYRGRSGWVGPMLAVGVYVLGVLSAVLLPGAATAAAMLPILSVVMVLPGRSRRGVAGILTVALVGSAVALLMATVPHPFPPLDEPLGSLFESASLLGVAVLILGALTDSMVQGRASLDGMRRILQARDADSAERTAIVASIGKLERKGTIETTAEVIVDALRKLPHIDLAAVFACVGPDLEILALAGPPDFPVGQGELLPEARARHLLDRMSGGPWAELWGNKAEYEEYGTQFTATGIKGLAYAPFFEGGRVIGVIAIGTRSDEHAARLVAELPAVAEFAATAGLLLTPMMVARREIEVAREGIVAIMAAGSFRPVFQPIVELSSGRTVGFEALTRFADGRPPNLVFASAIKAGMGLELELRTLESALAASRELPGGTWLSLNMSPTLLVEAIDLGRLLARRDRPLVIEITEHVAIDDYAAVRSAIERLGSDVRVAVDDAGAGIANFNHLVELRPHLVKVDAGLIRDLDTDLVRQAVVVGLVHFAAKAGCEIIAEGIETEAERATAHALGVTHVQGYLMARPGRAGTFARPAQAPRSPVVAGIETRAVVPAA